MSTALVRGPVALEIMRAVTLKPSFSWARTRIGRPPASVTASEKVGQCGDGITTSSPRSSRAWQARYSACLPPMVIATSSGAKLDLEVLAVAHGDRGAQLGKAGRPRVARAPRVEGGLRPPARRVCGVGWSGSPTLKSSTVAPEARQRRRTLGHRHRRRDLEGPGARRERSRAGPVLAARPHVRLRRRSPSGDGRRRTSRAGGARPRRAPARALPRRAGRPP